MQKIIYEITRLYPTYATAVGRDSVALALNAVGSFIISVTFIIIGLICIFNAGKDKSGAIPTERKRIAKLIGLFILTCGLSRAMDVASIWYNYAILNGLIKIITGIIASITIFYIPYIMKKIKQYHTLEEVKESIKETAQKIDNLQKIANG